MLPASLPGAPPGACFSALQRAEIAEIYVLIRNLRPAQRRFSALQRAEIAEITYSSNESARRASVSVLFNEPKLLKFKRAADWASGVRVSVLFNEPKLLKSTGC